MTKQIAKVIAIFLMNDELKEECLTGMWNNKRDLPDSHLSVKAKALTHNYLTL